MGSPNTVRAGGGEWDPGGAEWPAAESSGLRRRKAMSTSGCEATGPAKSPLTLTLSIDPLHFEEQQVPRARSCDEAQEERRETRKPMRYTCIGLRLIQLI